MADLINLNRARKAKARAEKDRMAKANRVAHGTPKALRKLEAARKAQTAERLSVHKLEKNSDEN
jgi:hypothetical protein